MEEKSKFMTILNRREGKLVLAPDPAELKTNPKAKERVIFSGGSLEVSAEEGAHLLNLRGVVDASTVIAPSMRMAELQQQLEAEKAKNADLLKKLGPAAESVDLSDDDDVLLPDGSKGTIVKLKKKGMADVKSENGDVSTFKLADLKPFPAE